MVVKWNNLFRIKSDNSQINSNHLGFLYGYGQDISERARWFIGSFEIIIQRMTCLWPVLEIACKSIRASVHPSRRYLCNIMNDTEMDKSWPLFQKAHRLVTKKQKGYYPTKVKECKMVAGIRCFGSGGKDEGLWGQFLINIDDAHPWRRMCGNRSGREGEKFFTRRKFCEAVYRHRGVEEQDFPREP